jgi:sirohydrochlorin cobaltochelatase
MRPALLLVAHGSPDPDWAAPLRPIRDQARALAPDRRVELAFLEGAAPLLEDALEDLWVSGVREVEIVALLLSGGGRHFKVDLPRRLAAAQERRPDLALTLRPQAIAAEPGVIEALARAALRRG